MDAKLLPEGQRLPAFTAADNGKVLGVVDGKLAFTDILEPLETLIDESGVIE